MRGIAVGLAAGILNLGGKVSPQVNRQHRPDWGIVHHPEGQQSAVVEYMPEADLWRWQAFDRQAGISGATEESLQQAAWSPKEALVKEFGRLNAERIHRSMIHPGSTIRNRLMPAFLLPST